MSPDDKRNRPGRQSEAISNKNNVGAFSDPILDDHRGPRVDVYGSSTVNRKRSTNAELAALDDAILEAVAHEHPVTLRGVFYRVMSAGAVEKTEAGYKKVGRQVLKLRRSGRIPYSWITDGTRYVVRPNTWRDVDEALHFTALTYRRQLWSNQSINVQVFTEKDAIRGVIDSITREWDVPLGILRGFVSESFAWEVAESLSSSKHTVMYQLGDHDPSGVAAWTDFEKKVRTFQPDADVVFERIAVTPEQIEMLSLPTRPTKKSDSRAAGFRGESVEVDAIPPGTLRSITREAIERHVDQRELELTKSVEQSEKDILRSMIGGGSR